MARLSTKYIVIHCSQTRPSQSIGAGVSARLKAVQILKLVEGKDTASSHLFKEEDGFETPSSSTSEASNEKTPEVQNSTDF